MQQSTGVSSDDDSCGQECSIRQAAARTLDVKEDCTAPLTTGESCMASHPDMGENQDRQDVSKSSSALLVMLSVNSKFSSLRGPLSPLSEA